MYQLVSHVADGLGKLKSLLEKHICTQGLSAIEKCGDSALNVSIARQWLYVTTYYFDLFINIC